MATLTIKNVDEALHEALKREASSDGRSLNSYVQSVLESAVREKERLRRMRGVRKELEEFVSSLPPSRNAVALIRKERERR